MIYWTANNKLKPLIKRMTLKQLLRGLLLAGLWLTGIFLSFAAHANCPLGSLMVYTPSVVYCRPDPNYRPPQQAPQQPWVNYDRRPLTQAASAALFQVSSAVQMQLNQRQLEKALKQAGALQKGSWSVYQEGEPPVAGQKCNAVWVNNRGAITIGTTRGLNDPALLIYTSDKIPKSKKQVPVTVHINENGEEWDVQAVRYTLPNSDLGSIFISLRSLKAAIGDIKDTGHVKVDVDGKEMIDISWKNGLEAKKKLAQCAKS